MTVVYTIILVDDTVGPLFPIKHKKCSSCTQLQICNQNKK
jgi:hypothetical protein